MKSRSRDQHQRLFLESQRTEYEFVHDLGRLLERLGRMSGFVGANRHHSQIAAQMPCFLDDSFSDRPKESILIDRSRTLTAYHAPSTSVSTTISRPSMRSCSSARDGLLANSVPTLVVSSTSCGRFVRSGIAHAGGKSRFLVVLCFPHCSESDVAPPSPGPNPDQEGVGER